MPPTESPVLSVVIPVRNGMPFIEEALSSVSAAGIDGIELIVRENWSTDGTTEWLRAHAESLGFRLVEAPEPASAAENWTAACELATGRYIKLLCADDFLCDGGLARQLAAALENPEAVLVASPRKVVSHSGRTVLAKRGLSGLRGVLSGSSAAVAAVRSGTNPFGEPSSVLFRADALKAALPFREAHPYVTDLEMYVRVLEHGRFVGLDTVDAAFRLSNSSWSSELGRRQLSEYRDWVASIKAEPMLSLSRSDLRASEMRLRANYLARRVISTATRIADARGRG